MMNGFRTNMRDFSVVQLLSLISLAGKSGTLLVGDGDRQMRLVFTEGLLTFARPESQHIDLLEILRSGGQIDYPFYRKIRETQSAESELELGIELVMAGIVTQAAVRESIRQYSTDIVRMLFSEMDGCLDFRPEESAPQGMILIDMPLAALIVEGETRLTEREQLLKEFPDLQVKLTLVNPASTNSIQFDSGSPEWAVISHISSQLSLAEIAKKTGMNEFEIRQAASQLLQAGIVQILVNTERFVPETTETRMTAAPLIAVESSEKKEKMNLRRWLRKVFSK